jgi:hypothetical protein
MTVGELYKELARLIANDTRVRLDAEVITETESGHGLEPTTGIRWEPTWRTSTTDTPGQLVIESSG